MKPATVAELRSAIERECAQITWGLFCDVYDSIALRCQQCLDQYRCNLRTGGDETINDILKLYDILKIK